MRALVPLLILLSLAAACGGGSTPHSTPTPLSTTTATRVPTATPAPTTQAVIPLTPVEETLTPPPDIDTSSWLTYRDNAHGFELNHPPDATIKPNAVDYLAVPNGEVRGTRIDLPVARETTLEEKYMFISVTNAPSGTCLPHEILLTEPPVSSRADVALVRSRDLTFWKTRGTSHVASSHHASEVGYQTSRANVCVVLVGVLYSVSADVFSTPPPSTNREEEEKAFTAIVATFRWTNP